MNSVCSGIWTFKHLSRTHVKECYCEYSIKVTVRPNVFYIFFHILLWSFSVSSCVYFVLVLCAVLSLPCIYCQTAIFGIIDFRDVFFRVACVHTVLCGKVENMKMFRWSVCNKCLSWNAHERCLRVKVRVGVVRAARLFLGCTAAVYIVIVLWSVYCAGAAYGSLATNQTRACVFIVCLCAFDKNKRHPCNCVFPDAIAMCS